MTASQDAVDLRRLWWVGPLTIVAAIVAVLAVRIIAFAVLDLSPEFVPLAWGALIVFTAVLVAAGVLVFAAVPGWQLARSRCIASSRLEPWSCQ